MAFETAIRNILGVLRRRHKTNLNTSLVGCGRYAGWINVPFEAVRERARPPEHIMVSLTQCLSQVRVPSRLFTLAGQRNGGDFDGAFGVFVFG